jgi:radical SAM protein with 4Fe4S-binding SPASM domain
MSSYNFHGLANVNVELTSFCNKNCWMCGRRRTDVEYPELALNYGNMDFELVKSIAGQLPPQIVVQLHNNGEALLYPRFGEAVKLFKRQIRNVVTNGKLLIEKADEIIGNLDSLAVSVFERDDEAEEQYGIIRKFIKIKGDRKPFVILRLNGNVDSVRYEKLKLLIVRRILHAPMGSYNYQKIDPTIPEIGMCWDFLNHMAINSRGQVSICVRYDPKGLGIIGDARKKSLDAIWNGPKRMKWLALHRRGLRSEVPLCSYCHFWGVPTGSCNAGAVEKVDENKIFGHGKEV